MTSHHCSVRREFSTPCRWGLMPPTFIQHLLASSPDNCPNSSQGVLNIIILLEVALRHLAEAKRLDTEGRLWTTRMHWYTGVLCKHNREARKREGGRKCHGCWRGIHGDPSTDGFSPQDRDIQFSLRHCMVDWSYGESGTIFFENMGVVIRPN